MRIDDRLLVRQRTLVVGLGPLPGVGWLTHRGDRVPGRRAAWTLPLHPREAGGSIEVAGRRVPVPADAESAPSEAWTWDGLDADGARVGRSTPVVVVAPDGSVRRSSLGRLDPRLLGLGGWTPELVHGLDPAARLLHLGDGRTQSRVPVQRVDHDGTSALEVASDTLRLRFAEDGRHLATIGRTGSRDVVLHWDAAGLTAWEVGGDVTRVRRSAGPDGDTTVELERGGRVTTLVVDDRGWLREAHSPAGRTATVRMGEGGLLEGVAVGASGELSAEHDEDGRLLGRRRPGEGWRRCTEVEVDGGRRVVWLSAEGRETRHEVHRAADGTVVRTTTCCGRSEPTTVRRQGETTTTTLPGGTVSTRSAVSHGHEQVVTLPSGTTLRTLRTAERAPDGTQRRTTVVGEEDAYVTLIGPDGRTATATTPEGRTSRARLDERGRTVRVELPGHPVVTTEHDDGGPVRIQRGDHVLAYRGADGRAEEVEDVNDGRIARFEHDADDLLVAAHLPGDRTLRLERDDMGAVVAFTPPGRPAHRWQRGPGGRIEVEELPPVDGRTDTVTRAFDDDGLLVRVERPGGTTRHLELDVAGRVARIRVVAPDGGARIVTHERDEATGRLVRTSADGLVTEHAWDGPVPVGERLRGPLEATLLRRHDDRGHVVGETIGGQEVVLSRDGDGLVTAAGNLRLVRDPASGHVVERWLGIVCEQLERRQDGLPVRRTVWVDQQPIASARYQWDTRGRLTQVAVERDGDTRTTAFTYDHADRLATVVEDGRTTHDHRWDPNGARLALHPDDPAPITVDDRDRPTSHGEARITHHPAGQRATRTEPDGSTWTYHHDDLGRLLGVDTPDHEVRHLLDAFGRRTVTTVDGAVTRRLLWGSQRHPAAEIGADGAVTARFVHAEDRLAPSLVLRDGRELLVVCDHVGSVWLVLDGATGEVVQELDHDVWGQVQHDTAPGTQPFGFAGGLVEEATPLVHLGARDYDPATGTWTARDPIGFASGTTNLHAYAEGDPVNRWDPTGTKVERCRKLSGIGWQADVGLDHHWIRTDSAEAGLGPHPEPTGNTVLGEGAEVAITDHTGRGDKSGATCEEVEDVDEECVNQRLATPNTSPSGRRYGKHLGNYLPWNQCQSAVDDILTSCSTREGWERWTDPYDVVESDEGPMSKVPDGGDGGGGGGRNYTPADYTPAEGYGDGEGGDAWE